MTDPRYREIERLEEELANTHDPVVRKEILDEIRDLEREESDRERWLDEGYDRGWL